LIFLIFFVVFDSGILGFLVKLGFVDLTGAAANDCSDTWTVFK